MTHLDEETLAGAALGESDALGRRQRWHLSRCRACAAQLAELGQVVATGRAGRPEPLRRPRPGLLAAIRAELDAEGEPVPEPSLGAGPGQDVPVLPVAPARSAAPSRRGAGRRTRWLVAAAVAVVVGATATVAYRQTHEQDVVATAVLHPLPTKSGRGTVEMVRRRDGQELVVSISTAPPADRFEELWLFSPDGGMISVGILPATGKATFPLPPAAGALAGYTVVDISLEPYDGNPAHSHNSILRGTLG